MDVTNDIINELRKNTLGNNGVINTPDGKKRLIYADWMASGRLYAPIENFMVNVVGSFVGNTHTTCSEVGRTMNELYEMSKQNIKELVNANQNDSIITTGTGMTAAINKLQSLMGLKNRNVTNYKFSNDDRPVVFITQYEHNSNYISWVECGCDVIILDSDEESIINFDDLEEKLIQFKDRSLKIGSFSSASNISGTMIPYQSLSKIMHKHGGLCFVDFSASAPYEQIDMHPFANDERLDAVFFSPHKFLGGPGSSGVVVFDSDIYLNPIPDTVGGGIIDYVSPWQDIEYFSDISKREDAGTPGFLQTIRASLAMDLKERIINNGLIEHEKALTQRLTEGLSNVSGIGILEPHIQNKIGVVSFYTYSMHYNLIGKLLSDKFGIQVRTGCMCASILAHNVFNIDREKSSQILNFIKMKNYSLIPGFVRISIHPTTSVEEIDFIIDAVKQIVTNYKDLENEYIYINKTGEFRSTMDSPYGQITPEAFSFLRE